MKNTWRWPMNAAACVLLGLAGALVATAPAQAQPVVTGSLAITGDPDDYVSGGQSYGYSTGAGDEFRTWGSLSERSFQIRAVNGDSWEIHLKAPLGENLASGTYQDTGAWESDGAQLIVVRPWHSCEMITGAFTISNAVHGPDDYLREFDVTFEQHCDGAAAALRGELHVLNPPPPPLLELSVTVEQAGTVHADGTATVSGTVTCSQENGLWVTVYLRQTSGTTQLEGSGGPWVECAPGAPVPWRFTLTDQWLNPFRTGPATVQAQATGYDIWYDQSVTSAETTVPVLLRRG